MLHQENIINSGPAEPLTSERKALSLNGHPVIEYRVYDRFYQSSLFTDKNMLVVAVDGVLRLRYGDSKYDITKNQMVFLKNHTMIDYQAASMAKDQGRIGLIFFSPDFDLLKEFVSLSQLSITSRNYEKGVSVSMLDRRLQKYMDSLFLYFDAPAPVNETVTRFKLLELLFCLAGSAPGILALLLDFRKDFLPNMTAVVKENIMNPVSIGQLAVLCGRSLSSFRRDFLSVYNMPPSQWIRKKRLKKAGELLLNTNMTVTDICYTTGFENISHFSRLFKSQYGMSPTEYRVQRTCFGNSETR